MAEEVRSADTALNADWGCILRNIVKRWWMILLAAVTAASGAYNSCGEILSANLLCYCNICSINPRKFYDGLFKSVRSVRTGGCFYGHPQQPCVKGAR